jgi:hypothetical protein
MHLFPPVTAKCSSYCGDRWTCYSMLSFSILQVRCGMQRPLETVLDTRFASTVICKPDRPTPNSGGAADGVRTKLVSVDPYVYHLGT